MALFEVEVTMNVGERHWQNRWDVDADDITTVLGMVDAFHDFHLGILLDLYQLGRIVVRPAGERDAFFEFTFDAPGSRDSTGNKVLPLFNTVRLLLDTLVGGRPGQKFLRGFLLASDLTPEGTIIPAATALVSAGAAALIAAVEALGGHIVLTNDKQVATETVQNLVQMRQLHRKRKNPTI